MQESRLHCQKVQELMRSSGVDLLVATSPVYIYYLTGHVVGGYAVLLADGDVWQFVRRPLGLDGERVRYIRKPEEIPSILMDGAGLRRADVRRVALELDSAPYNTCQRLAALYADGRAPFEALASADALLRRARAVKTEWEQEEMRRAGRIHASCYVRVPDVYRRGMSDHEFAIEFERLLRQAGHIGLFRTFGTQMEAFMGSSFLVGDNADVPSPYDFALGGAGMTPALPVGEGGTALRDGQTLMVDGGGCFGAYMTDMTRVYAYGPLPELALRAHRCSIAIHDLFRSTARAGVSCAAFYDAATNLAHREGLADYFMGHRQQAAFVGHGVGLEINELPVFHGRSKDVLEAGNVVAIEPKFVIPGVGAVGVENTYIVHADGAECITVLDEDIVMLER